jgi:hypothetical protein
MVATISRLFGRRRPAPPPVVHAQSIGWRPVVLEQLASGAICARPVQWSDRAWGTYEAAERAAEWVGNRDDAVVYLERTPLRGETQSPLFPPISKRTESGRFCLTEAP